MSDLKDKACEQWMVAGSEETIVWLQVRLPIISENFFLFLLKNISIILRATVDLVIHVILLSGMFVCVC